MYYFLWSNEISEKNWPEEWPQDLVAEGEGQNLWIEDVNAGDYTGEIAFTIENKKIPPEEVPEIPAEDEGFSMIPLRPGIPTVPSAQSQTKPEKVRTGDTGHIILWLLLLAGSLGAGTLIVFIKYRKRKKN